MKWILYLLAGIALARSDALALEVKLSFQDACSKVPVVYDTPNGSEIRLRIKGVDAGKPASIDFDWTLAGLPDADRAAIRIRESATLSARELHQSGEFVFPLPPARKFRRMETFHPGSRIWELKVLVVQGGKAAMASESLFRVPSGFEYYRVLPGYTCLRGLAPAPSSPYRINPSQTDALWISRNQTLPVEDGGGRKYSSDFFPGRKNENTLNAYLTLDREYKLSPGQGGLFATRAWIKTAPAVNFQWKEAEPDSEKCGGFVRKSQGWLEVPVFSEDFYTLPASIIGDPDSVRDFLSRLAPPFNTCSRETPVFRSFPADSEFRFTPTHFERETP